MQLFSFRGSTAYQTNLVKTIVGFPNRQKISMTSWTICFVLFVYNGRTAQNFVRWWIWNRYRADIGNRSYPFRDLRILDFLHLARLTKIHEELDWSQVWLISGFDSNIYAIFHEAFLLLCRQMSKKNQRDVNGIFLMDLPLKTSIIRRGKWNLCFETEFFR